MPGLDVNGASCVIVPSLASARCAEAFESGFVSQLIELWALFPAV